MVQERDDVVLIDAVDPRRRRRCGRRAATSPTSPTRSSTAPSASSASASTTSTTPTRCPNCGKRRHVHRGPRVQPDVQDPRRPGRGRRRRASTCARRRRRACSSTSPTCCRRARKKPPFGIAQVGKSFRNEITPRQLHLPHPRVRADGDGVLRAAGRRAEVVRVLVQRARSTGTSRLGIPREHAAPAPARRRRAEPLLGRHERRRVPVPVGLGRARGHRPAHRLRPQAARRSTPASSSTTSTRRRTSATCRT